MAYTSGGTRVTTTVENQELLRDVRLREDEYYPHLKLTNPLVTFILREVTIDVESPCYVRINGGSPIYVKDCYSNANIKSIVVEEPGTEVILAYNY